MKIYIILFCVCTIVFQNCTAQSNNNIEFTYQRGFFEEDKIVENFSYNSKTGIYEYQLNNAGYEKVIKKVIINLKDKDKLEIYNLYLKLFPKNLKNCMFENGKEVYSSTIIFNNVSLKNNCNTYINDERNYKIIEDKLYDFFSSNAAYRTIFPEEFIKR